MKIQIGTGAMSLQALGESCKGNFVLRGLSAETTVTHVATDSREVDENTLFAALFGERVDGHDYMEKALLAGCRLFLCQRVPMELLGSGKPFGAIIVEDTEKALGLIASVYADAIDHKTVAVTGSVGKTTTKEWIAAVLGERYRLHKTKANHNSTLGMPMSLMEMSSDTEVSVLEMGMSGFGEISYMSRIGKPDIACITNIGSSHLEALGSRENICRAKLEILEGLSPTGLVVLNGDELLLSSLGGSTARRVYVALDNHEADYLAQNIRFCDGDTTFDVLKKDGEVLADIRLSVLGKQFVYGALFAIAVGFELGMSFADIRRGLERFENAAMRQNIYECGGITIIEDCYNASPESMRAAADVQTTLSVQRNGARRVAILGDMRELGVESPKFHREVGAYFAKKGTDILITVGALAKDIALGAIDGGMNENAVYVFPDFEEREAIAKLALSLLKPHDILLAKASRAVGAEHIIALIRGKL